MPSEHNPVNRATKDACECPASCSQSACLTLLAVAFLGIVASVRLYPLIEDGIYGDVPSATLVGRAGRVEERVDPNTAGWAELARLPRIGEATAKRIVAHREARRAGDHSAASRSIVFRSPQDLAAVEGIGPKTLVRIADYLKFPDHDP